MEKRHLLFVYGTLKRDHHNHHHLLTPLGGAQFVTAGRTRELLRLVVAPPFRSPFLLKPHAPADALKEPQRSAGHRVRGEVWSVTEEMLQKLDVFEGCPTYYERLVVNVVDGSMIQVEASEIEPMECFVYVKKSVESFLDDLESIEEYHPDPFYVPPDKRPHDWKSSYLGGGRGELGPNSNPVSNVP